MPSSRYILVQWRMFGSIFALNSELPFVLNTIIRLACYTDDICLEWAGNGWYVKKSNPEEVKECYGAKTKENVETTSNRVS